MLSRQKFCFPLTTRNLTVKVFLWVVGGLWKRSLRLHFKVFLVPKALLKNPQKEVFLERNFLEIFGDITLDVKKSVKVGRVRGMLTSFERQN